MIIIISTDMIIIISPDMIIIISTDMIIIISHSICSHPADWTVSNIQSEVIICNVDYKLSKPQPNLNTRLG